MPAHSHASRFYLCALTGVLIELSFAYEARGATANFDAITGNSQLDNSAGVMTWNTTNTNWSTTGGISNTSWNGQDAVFGAGTGAAGTVTLGTALTATSLTFNTTSGSNYTLTNGNILANTLTLSTGAVIANTDASINVVLAGAGSLTKTGAGTLTLTQVNTYTGATSVSLGNLQFGNGGAFAGTPYGATSGIAVASGSQVIFNTSSNFTLGVVVSGAGQLVKTGSGTMTINGSLNQLFTGGLTISGGTVSAIGNQTGAQFAANTLVTINSGGTFSFDNTNPVGPDPTSSFVVNTGGTLNFGANSFHTHVVGITLAGGQMTSQAYVSGLKYSPGGTYSSDFELKGAITVVGNATNSASIINLVNGIELETDPTLGASTFNVADVTGSSSADLILMGGTAVPTAGILQIGDVGSSSYIKTGLGTMSVRAAANYNGTTSINQGAVNIQNNTALGTSTVSVASGAALEFEGGIAVGSSNATTLNGTGISSGGALRNIAGNNSFASTIALASASRINSDADTLTLSGAISGAFGLTVGGAGNVAMTSVIGIGANTLSKDGTGTLTLSGTNTYTGATNILAGVVNIQSAAALGTTGGNTVVSAGAALQTQFVGTIAEAITLSGTGINNDGALRNMGTTTTLSGIVTLASDARINSDAGTLTLSAAMAATGGAHALTVGGAGNTTISAALVTAAVTSLTKDGAGTLTLSGTNTFAGTTSVLGGTLTLNYATLNNSKLANAAALILGGGAVNLTGGSHTEVVASTTLLASTASSITRASGTSILQLGLITVGAGASIDFGTTLIATTTSQNTNGVLGGWATVGNGADLAANSAASGVGNVITYTGYTNVTDGSAIASSASSNVKITDTVTTGAALTLASAGTTDINNLVNGQAFATSTTPTAINIAASQTLRLGVNGAILSGATTTALTIGSAANVGALTAGGAANTAGTLFITSALPATRTTTINSAIVDNGSGVVSLVKSGVGNLTLAGSNTYTGATALLGGITSVSLLANGGTSSNIGSASAAASNLVLSGGTLQYTGGATTTNRLFSLGIASGTLDASGSGAVAFTGTGAMGFNGSSGARTLTLTGSNTGNNTLAALIADNGGATSLNKTGTGTWVLSGANTYTGATTLSTASTLKAGSSSAFGVGNLNLSVSGATVDLTSSSVSVGSLSGASGTLLTLGANTLTSGSDNTSTSFAGVISGSGGLTKNGTGALTLSGANTYTGATSVNGGTLKAGVASTAGVSGAFGNNSALTLANTAGSAIDITGFNTQIGSLAGGGASGGNMTLGAATLTIAGTSNTSYGGTISGAGGVTLNAGTQTFTGANLYSGVTSIASGATLAITQLAASGGASGIGAASIAASNLVVNGTLTYVGSTAGASDRGMTLGAAGTLDASGTSSAASATYTGTIAYAPINSNATLTLTGSNTGDNTLGGALANNGTGTTSLTKSGTGTWLLTGTNTYTGSTTINSGILLVNGSQSSGAGNYAVTSGASLGGSGTITTTGNVTVAGQITGGTFGTIGTLNIAGGTGTRVLTGTYLFDVNYNLQTGDLLNITGASAGTVSINGGTFQLGTAVGSTPAVGSNYAIKIFSSNVAATGAAAGQSNYAGSVAGLANYQSIVTWDGGKTYYLVPEPSSFALFGLGSLLLLRRPSRRHGRG